ncbi:alpha/beta fold hydrolase [Streptomyces sp. NPDC058371]|uniref:alpha/beta fold hydrolase n=1 Tax=Streptomyces sp. NPDC058371 TaxID=3346463 RepID=UPI003659BF9D
MSETTRTYALEPGLRLEITEAGAGRTVLVLHGGGGPGTVEGLARRLAGSTRTVTPTHPGWNGTERPERLANVADLAAAYLRFLAAEGLDDVLVVGSSVGGWIAMEMALQDQRRGQDHGGPGRVGGIVLIDSVGVRFDEHPIRDVLGLDPRAVAAYSFHDAGRFLADPATVTPEQAAVRRDNMATLSALAGDPYMHDPTLLPRLARLAVPTLVLWGASDRIVTPEYGRQLARAIPGARLVVVPEAGHLPQLERPEATVEALLDFHRAHPGRDAQR